MPPDRRSRDELIRLLLPRVRVIARRHIRRVSSRAAIAEDIYSAGLEGLVRGVDRYDEQRGPPRPYVERRIEGEIRDYLRSLDHLTRHFRGKAKATGVESWSAPVSLDADNSRGAALRDAIPDQGAMDPEEESCRRSAISALERAARALPPRTQDVLRRYYTDAEGMVEIAGAIGGITESRVCQLIHEAHARIREALGVVGSARKPPQKRGPRRRRGPVVSDEPREILRQSAEERVLGRPPRQCSVCGEPDTDATVRATVVPSPSGRSRERPSLGQQVHGRSLPLRLRLELGVSRCARRAEADPGHRR